ncbi:class F sortase [Kineococcus sp. SYSU DK005]|uniref:class F sortase n=1 Tax=Kineococcus sp. SYSU DK005 TaxID=3383126 RepID=UPI003D7D8F1C
MRALLRHAAPVASALLGAGLLGAWWAERPPAGFGDPTAATAPAAPAASPAAPPPAPAPTPAGGAGAAGPVPAGSVPVGSVPAAALPAFPPVAARPAAPAPPVPVVAPVALRVPDLGIEAPVDPVGVTADGAVQVPRDGARTGWYRFGPVPGEDGSAVLVGHVDTASDGPGALHPLARAEAGQVVEVVLADGTARRFAVTARREVVKAELPVRELFERTGPARLVLVTCGGEFDEETRSYASNVVVAAQPLPA